MKSLAVLVLLATPVLVASPVTVFSNFGPGQSYGGTSVNVTGASSLMGYEALTVPFTASASVVLSQVDVAFIMLDPFLGGVGSFTLNLLADSGNQPGAILADLDPDCSAFGVRTHCRVHFVSESGRGQPILVSCSPR